MMAACAEAGVQGVGVFYMGCGARVGAGVARRGFLDLMGSPP